MRLPGWLKSYWPLLLPPLLLLPGIAGFPYPSSEAVFSDIPITFYPNLYWLKQSLFEFHSVPFWSPLILSGSPFAANPQSGLHYPFGWPALLFPLPLGINIMVMLHLLWGGIGMAAFLRGQGRSPSAALFGGLAFALMPKLWAHYGAGHLAIVYAVVWLPWLLWAVAATRRRWYTQPGLMLAIIFLASPMWAAFSGLLWLSWEAGRFWLMYKNFLLNNDMGGRVMGAIRLLAKRIGLQLSLTLLLSAPLLLPLLEYTQLSTRSQMKVEDILTYSMGWFRLMFLPYPGYGDFHEQVAYPGALVLCLALTAVVLVKKQPKVIYWAIVVCVSWLYALGWNLDFIVQMSQLPGFSLLRVPPRAMFLAGTGLAVLAAYGFDHLLLNLDWKYARKLGWAGLLVFALLFGLGYLQVPALLIFAGLWGAVWIIAFTIWYFSSQQWKAMGLILLTILLIDLLVMDHSLFSMHPVNEVVAEAAAEAEYLAMQPGRFRVYSPSYSLPQQTAVRYGLELADGVDPLQLRSYADYMEQATGVPSLGYGVTQPPYLSGDPSTDNHRYTPDVGLLQTLGVKYVVSAFPLDIEANKVEQVGESRIYTLDEVDLPEVVSPNERHWQVQGGGVVTIPELFYPGWRASVDGEKAELLQVDGVLQGVAVPAGLHELTLKFQPVSLYVGLGLAMTGVIALSLMTRKEEHGR